jgi:hypothetical protein
MEMDFENSFDIYEEIGGNKYVFATIKLRAEIEEEDERLKLMLENFAIQLNLQELKIFRDSDINEELPNYLLLNEKRKEMLLEYHNIFPYIGSYKALVNIINFFGYGDTRLKEYWLNVDKTKKLKKSKASSFFNKNVPPIDLSSLHSFGNAFKPLPNIKNPAQDTEALTDTYSPTFGETDLDFSTKALGNLSAAMKKEHGKGIVGKRPNVTGNAIEPADPGDMFSQYVDSQKTIQAIKDIASQPLPEEVINSIQEQQFRQIEIPMQLAQKGKHWQSEEMLPNKIWKKTNLFGLFYDITRESGEYDIYGMPITEDAFMFSEDEVLVKLFALREYLKQKFMPINARIIDIVGEGIYFDRWAINIWKDDVVTRDVVKNEVVDFSMNAGNNLITDLQDYGTHQEIPSDSTIVSDLSKSFLNNYSNGISFKNNNGPVGCRTLLSLKEFTLSWDECDAKWYELEHVTWDHIAYKEYYEIEWIVTHETSGKFVYNVRGSIDTFKEHTVDLPYKGNYTVICIMYDLTNHSVRKEKLLTVHMPIPDFIGFGRSINSLDTWDDCKNLTWDDMQCEWRNPAISNNVTWDDLDGLTWDDLDVKKYEDQDASFIETNKVKVLRISESDRYVGNLFGFDASINKITCIGSSMFPELRNSLNGVPQDYVFLRHDKFVQRIGILNVTYTAGNTELTLESLPKGINNSWEVLREIGQTILIEGDLLSRTDAPAVGEYVRLQSKDKSIARIPISGVIGQFEGITISSSINVIPSEYGIIYKVGIIDTSNNIVIDAVNKQITTNVTTGIIPGFTILDCSYQINGENLSQHLLVKHMNGNVLDVIELDGDMGIMKDNITLNIAISYVHNSFNAKVIHYNKGNGTTEVYCNFNDYPYNTEFATDSSGWYFDYMPRYGDVSLEILNIGYEGNNTVITVNDMHSELYTVSPSFALSWITFDEDYAETRYGTNIFTWDNISDVAWDDCKHLTWNMLEYQKAPLCGFKIKNVEQNGLIQFNELPFFEFKSLNGLSGESKFVAAVNELNTTENAGLGRFNYILNSNNGQYEIIAIAKNEGKYYLGYLIFERGVIGEYSNPNYSHSYPVGAWASWNTPYIYGTENKYANWNPVARAYYEFGYDYANNKGWYPAEYYKGAERFIYESPKNAYLNIEQSDIDNGNLEKFPGLKNSVAWRTDEAQRLLYDYAITSPFTWNDFFASKNVMNLNKLTTVFFNCNIAKVAGQKSFIWTLKEHGSSINECVVIKDSLIWTFTKGGTYDLKLEIIDINGNDTQVEKQGLIIVK